MGGMTQFNPLTDKAYHIAVQHDKNFEWDGPRLVMQGEFTLENDRAALALAKQAVEAYKAGDTYTAYVNYGTRYDNANDSVGYVQSAWDRVDSKHYTFVKTRRLGYVEADELAPASASALTNPV